jgi:hypothetical protein
MLWTVEACKKLSMAYRGSPPVTTCPLRPTTSCDLKRPPRLVPCVIPRWATSRRNRALAPLRGGYSQTRRVASPPKSVLLRLTLSRIPRRLHAGVSKAPRLVEDASGSVVQMRSTGGATTRQPPQGFAPIPVMWRREYSNRGDNPALVS